jgi:hypothetical protein
MESCVFSHIPAFDGAGNPTVASPSKSLCSFRLIYQRGYARRLSWTLERPRPQSLCGFQSGGGNEMPQKPGMGLANSTGIRNPSGVWRGERVTRQATRPPVRAFSKSKRESASNARSHSNMAPWSLTATVCAGIPFGGWTEARCSFTGTRIMTRWLRRRSSAGRSWTRARPSSRGLVTVPGPRNPSPASPVPRRAPNPPYALFPSRRPRLGCCGNSPG